MKKILMMIVTVLVTGCATMPYQPYAREVKKKPNEGGLIALKTQHRPEDRQRADSLMAANCGSNAMVKVAEEGEVVVGEKTNSTSNKRQDQESNSVFSLNGMSFGRGTRPVENTDTSSETVQLKEWQIAYNCETMQAIAPTSNPVKKKTISKQ